MTVDAVADAIDAVGEMVTLRRILAPDVQVSVTTRARADRPAIQNDELPGNVRQYAAQYRIHDRDIMRRKWPGPPRRGDQVIMADGSSATIQSVDILKIGDDVAQFVLQVSGS